MLWCWTDMRGDECRLVTDNRYYACSVHRGFIAGCYDGGQNLRDEERRVDQQQQSRWRPTRRQLLWASATFAFLTVAILIGYRYGITLWDWIKLLVVPAVLAGGGLWFNQQQRARELQLTAQREKADRRLAELDRQDAIVQSYLDQIGQLMLDKDRPLRQSEERDEVRTLARAYLNGAIAARRRPQEGRYEVPIRSRAALGEPGGKTSSRH
jgi:hypothetical protein